MSYADKLESMLEFLCNDVYEIFSTHLDKARNYTEYEETPDNVKEIFKIALHNQGTLLKPILNAAAMSDVFCVIRESILSDKKEEEEELALVGEFLQKSLHRYCWLDDYKKHLNAKNAQEIQALMKQWKEDPAWLGGDILEGAIVYPFSKFVTQSCILTTSPALYQTYAKMILMSARLILKSNGITSSDQIYYAQMSSFLTETDAVLRSMQAAASSITNQNSSESEDKPVSQSSKLKPEDALLQGLDELTTLVGLDTVKTEVSRLTNFLKIRKQRLDQGLPVASQTLHFVFTGNPGTGKTTVARIIAKILYGFQILKTPNFIEADRATLVGGYVGQTAIKTNEVIAKATDGVLFIDEAYSLAKSGGQDYGHEAIETLLKKMEDLRDRLVVIVAGYPNEMAEFISSNPGLESRFSRYITFDDYHVSDLCQIFELMCNANSYQLTSEARGNLAIILNRVFAERDQNFGNARLVRNAYERTLGNHADRLATNEGTITREALSTIEAIDLPFKFASTISAPFDLKDSIWHVNCPQCENSTTASLPFLGQFVKCNNCSTLFRCPWWNLDRNTVPGMKNFEIFERPSDLDGYDVQEERKD